MDKSNDISRAELVDRYVQGDLSTQERQLFQSQMQEDERLRQEVEDTQIAQSLLQHYGLRNEIRAVRAAMKQEEAEEPILRDASASSSQPTTQTPPPPAEAEESSSKTIPLFSWAGRIAAGLALLIVGYLVIQYATLSPRQLYDERVTAEAPYLGLSSRSMEDREDTLADQVRVEYQFGNFDEVIRLYGQLSDPTFAETFRVGYAYLQRNKPEQAIDAFRQVVDNSNAFMIKDKAEYYLALAYLQADQVDQATGIMQRINSSEDHDYADSIGSMYLWRLRLLNMKQ